MADAAPDPALSALPDEVQATFDHLPATLAGYAAGAAVMALLFWGGAKHAALLVWLGAFAALWFVRLALGQRYQTAARPSLADWTRWRSRANLAGLASGAMWGLAGVLFHVRGENIQQTGLILLVYAFCVAAMPVLATQPRVYVTYLAVTAGPLIVRIASDGDAYALQLAALLTLTVTMTGVLGGNYRRAFARIIDLRLRMSELLAQLRAEKESADAARREAEVANRAKTQFFAAASHDLRQPLHAMGLFAEALRQRTRDSEVAPLVNSINESVDALETLFSELLDITRLDSGHVEVNPRAFQLGDVLRRLRLHFEPEAFEKGLAFRIRGAAQVVHADPVIVERILRNLVSNAIRYTEDGGVLVGCRRRAGKVLLQVWDSGPGITPEQQARVFEEFYQVPRERADTPGQPKGLGLGLSIVKRLAELIGARLTLGSWPGRGSVFTLELMAAQAGEQRAGLATVTSAPSLTLQGRRVIVVEDEAAVRAGIESLLTSWGAQLRAFDSVSGCIAWVSRCGIEEPAPDLVLIDYRLEDGHNGIEALLALRRRFGSGVPAIMVTGSTMSRVELEAQEHQFHVLIKPVLPNKLRAMIGFKLAGRAAADQK